MLMYCYSLLKDVNFLYLSFKSSMSFSSLFLFFFGAIGVFNSFLVSLYFIFKKTQNQLSTLFFGLFLLFFSERAFRSLIYFFSDVTPNAYSKFGPITFLFIGPFLLLYVVSEIQPKSKMISFWKYHIAFWFTSAIALHIIYPFRTDPIFYKAYILKAINMQWLVYTIISGLCLVKYMRTVKPGSKTRWFSLLIGSVIVMWLIYFFISFNYFVIGSIVFSVIFYSFFLYFLFKKKRRFEIFEMGEKYGGKKIDQTRTAPLIDQLKSIMKEQKPYKNPKLKLTDLAHELGVSTHQFSQLLNDNLEKSFSNFINEYRIEEAKQIIRSNTNYTLDAIGHESGFNSKSSFYTSFKRLEGMTPSAYRAQFFSSKL